LLIATILAGTIWPAVAQTGFVTPVDLQTILATNTQGAVVSLRGIDLDSRSRISMSQTFTGGKLIFSDSPESPTSAGILYMDTNLAATASSEPNRVFVYHVNASPSGRMKFSALIRNKGTATATLMVHQTGIAGPGADYMLIGETALYRWLTSSPGTPRAVAPGQTIRLDTRFDSIKAGHGDLVEGIWDYTFDQPHAIIICALDSDDNPVAVGSTLKVLARDFHDRGTFAHCNKLCSANNGAAIETDGGVRQFPIGGDGDVYVTGWDNTVSPPITVENDGNYGVLYTVKMKIASDDSKALALLISPRGGAWCGVVNAAPGLSPGGPFIIPSDGRAISDPFSAAVEAEYSPGVRKDVWFQFMPAGASSFPVYVMTVPFSRHR
jgi:hypothetical protein